MRTTIIVFLLTLSAIACSQTSQTYEYLSMTQVDNEIKLNKNSESFETIDVKAEMSKDSYDYRPLLKRIQEYEKQGWEIVSNNVYVTGQGIFPRNYVLMRRKK
jgi:hypothetical protein